ncbi:DUF5688 family protein [Hespellia stercorisuis]|uniref:Uncharacterized protein n=1 Tax=Hespellia stercorisuis DSM 15480 TaxID=1121950 RepID=A0A1M6U2U7_9FIRM|nr:DUF5688 family protein [Hespellia stercorisuis]SHK63506.1 hypothetical protein SAMN02745243_03386 [Hespellia stercorisuis DSM 15480]
MMKYNEFKRVLLAELKRRIGWETMIQIQHVKKINQAQKEVLVISKKEECIIPRIDLDGLYEDYKTHENIEKIIQYIYCIIVEKPQKIGMYLENEWEQIKDKIVIKMINKEWNAEYISEIPHKDILDLTAIYQIVLDQDKSRRVTRVVTNDMLEQWGVTEEEIHAAGMNNLRREDFAMRDLLGVISQKLEMDMELDPHSPMYIVTNEKTGCGADVLFFQELLKIYAEYLQSDLYILPSSIYEVIIVRKAESPDVSELQQMVKEINHSQVDEEERLSDSVYLYRMGASCVELLADMTGEKNVA